MEEKLLWWGQRRRGQDSSFEALGKRVPAHHCIPSPRPVLMWLGTDRVLTSRTEPAGRGHRWASASGTWASRRQPGRRACSSRLLCSAASRAGGQDAEGGNFCLSCLLPQPPPVPEVGACLPAPVGGTAAGPQGGGGAAPSNTDHICPIISPNPGQNKDETYPITTVLEFMIWGQKNHSGGLACLPKKEGSVGLSGSQSPCLCNQAPGN